MPETPLRVWVLSDSQPGHYNLSRGVIAALKRVRPVEEHRLTVRLRFGLMRNLLRFFLNKACRLPASSWMRLFYVMPDLPAQRCDLIVSAGGKTSFANAWLSRDLSVPNIFTGSLRRLSAELFTVILTLEPVDPPSVANLVLDLPPSTIDSTMLERKGEQLRQDLQLAGQRLYTLLIGGDGAGYQYDVQDWKQLAQLLNVLGELHQIRWLLLGSRRTGAEAQRIIESTVDSALIAHSVWYEPGKPVEIGAYLGAAEQVFVTEDSMTMVTEAIYSQRSVISLRPAAVDSTRRYEAMMKRFSDRRWICRYGVSSLLERPGQLAEHGCIPLAESPLDDLSEQLARRLQL
jgi:mitochondrial fission protein ELM1